jgi:hypothetical protein
MNEARTAEEYKRQKYAEKRKETAKERNRDNRRYYYSAGSTPAGIPGMENNYFTANGGKNKKDANKNHTWGKHYRMRDKTEDKKIQADGYRTIARADIIDHKFKNRQDKAAAYDAANRHNRRHPDRKLESGIFGVTY